MDRKRFKCNMYNTIRLECAAHEFYNADNPLKHTIVVYNCCVSSADKDTKPLGTITFEDIDNGVAFEKITSFFNYPTAGRIFHSCFSQNYFLDEDYRNHINTDENLDEYYCDWQSGGLKNVIVSFQRSCNLHCTMCRDRSFVDPIIDDYAFKLLEQLKGHHLRSISLTQNGEPFLYKDRMMSYLKSLTREDCETLIIISNLTLLDDNNIDDLIELNKRIKIDLTGSIDGITDETYKSIRLNDQFDKVIHNANRLHEGNVKMSINFVAQKKNIHEMVAAHDYWVSRGIDFRVLPINQGVDDDPDYQYIINHDEFKNYMEFIKN